MLMTRKSWANAKTKSIDEYLARAKPGQRAALEKLRKTIHAVAPNVDGKSSHGGYCGPAVKPIALHMLSQVASDPEVGVPISGIGGIATWQDSVEFLALGASSMQVCTAAMHYGFRMVEDLVDGLTQYLERKGYKSLADVQGKAVPRVTDWGHLNLNYKVVARIDPGKCIQCNLCHIACEDGAHQCIRPVQPGVRDFPVVDESSCVGCNLCSLVCPVDTCITMTRLDDPKKPAETWGQRVARTGSTLAAWEASDTHHAGSTTGTTD